MLTEGPNEQEAAALQQHVEYLETLSQQGIVLLAGRTQTAHEESFGIVILRAMSEDTAGEIMRNDPAVKLGIMTSQLYPYRIAVLSRSIVEGHVP